MLFCCVPQKEQDEDILTNNIPPLVQNFSVCPQIFFTNFSKFIFLKHFLNFKNNFKERNSKKNTKRARIEREIQILQFMHSGKRNKYIL
tara:strand:+ start:1571 stop:1837 length:267 start_codon:yes stop_codon:yes gene_type:complete